MKQQEEWSWLPIALQIAKKLAPKYACSYHDKDDVIQEAILIARKAMKKYDENKGSISSFLYKVLSNRLKNFIRNSLKEPDRLPLDDVLYEDKFENDVEHQEIIQNILDKIPLDLRPYFIMMQHGAKLSSFRKNQVIFWIKENYEI